MKIFEKPDARALFIYPLLFSFGFWSQPAQSAADDASEDDAFSECGSRIVGLVDPRAGESPLEAIAEDDGEDSDGQAAEAPTTTEAPPTTSKNLLSIDYVPREDAAFVQVGIWLFSVYNFTLFTFFFVFCCL
jgi:hypothetical protein